MGFNRFFDGGGFDDPKPRTRTRTRSVPKEWHRKNYKPTSEAEFGDRMHWLLHGYLPDDDCALEEYLEERYLERRPPACKPIPLPQPARHKRVRLENAVILRFPKKPDNWKTHEEQVTAAFRQVRPRD